MKKGIPLGIKNYRELKEKNYYVVDKSLLIQEFLERMAKATLVTRPRRDVYKRQLQDYINLTGKELNT